MPGAAAFEVGVVVKLVHDHVVDLCLIAVAQGDVGKNLRGATEDGCAAIDAGVACHHADIFRTEIATEREELLVDQCLNRAGVNGLAA